MKLQNSWSRRLFANSSWGSAATAFSLLSQFYVCGCEWYKLSSGKRCIVGEENRLGGKTVGFKYPVWLLCNIDSNANTHALSQWPIATTRYNCYTLILLPYYCYTLHQTEYSHSPCQKQWLKECIVSASWYLPESLLWKCHHRSAIMGIRWCSAIAVEACKRQAASASSSNSLLPTL